MTNIEYELNEKIHAIIINPYLSWEDFCTNCVLIKKYNIKNISTSLNYLDDFKNCLSNYSANINALISYPLADLPVSIIINKSKLQEEVFINAIEISLELGIKNFQFGDGFGPTITSNDVAEILKIIGSENQIKVVGGIKKLKQVIDLFEMGISCVGTSNFCEIFQEVKVI